MAEIGKKILIIGNGFDLAHGLPTKYSDFLEFCKRVELIFSFLGNKNQFVNKWVKTWHTVDDIKKYFVEVFDKRRNIGDDCEIDEPVLTEIHNLLKKNVWYLYFYMIYSDNKIKGENWIDFESEISFIIQEIDKHTNNLRDDFFQILEISKESTQDSSRINILKKITQIISCDNKMNIYEFRKIAYADLEKITRVLELYLARFVNEIEIEMRVSEIDNIKPDYVINFNYTNTYERVYNNAHVFYIHGKCDANRVADENNMVLGIDEYWNEDKRNSNTNFTIFKKFAQRIQKHTGNNHNKYLNEIDRIYNKNKLHWSGNVDIYETHPDGISDVYIFGHSLDITDKDILFGFIGRDCTNVTIYCYNKEIEGELIANTIKLINEEQLLNKVNSVPEKLKYVIQKN